MTEEKQKLTKEFLLSHRVVFKPKTTAEAMFIQESLKDMGIGWARGHGVGSFLDECVSLRMVVEDGVLYYNPEVGPHIKRSAQDFGGFDMNELLSPQEKFLHERFNALNAKVDHMTALLEKVVEKIDPKPIDKPLPSVLGPKNH